MNIVQDNIDELNATLKISIKPDDYKEAYEKVLLDYRKQVSLPGFRAGKVPVGLIKKKHGPGILVEEIQKILNESLDKHIKENKLSLLGQPLPVRSNEVGDWENPADFEFSYDLGIAPKFDLTISDKEKFTYYKIKVEDKMLDEEIDRLAKQYGSLVDTDKSLEKDLVYGEFVQLDAEGKELEDGIRNSTTVFVDSVEDKKTKKQFIGLKTDDEIIVDPIKISSNHDEVAKLLGLTHEQVHGLISKFSFKVNMVRKVEAAKIDEELFTKVFANESIKTEKDFRNTLSERISAQFENNSKDLFKRDVSKQLVDKLKLKLPKDFLIRWTAASNNKSVEEAAVDYDFHAEGLKWQLIMNKITEDNDIKVDFEETMDFTKETLKSNYAQYGYPAPDDEELKETAMKVLKNQEEASRVFEVIRENKIFDFIKKNAKVSEKEIGFDKFKKMAEA
ncbi:MAG: trigger factor [Patiriisocius sp.]|jgi:trigger factor